MNINLRENAVKGRDRQIGISGTQFRSAAVGDLVDARRVAGRVARVLRERFVVEEHRRTERTLEFRNRPVQTHVRLEIAPQSERFVAVFTRIRTSIGMYRDVIAQLLRRFECLLADVAREWPRVAVDDLVVAQSIRCGECCRARFALEVPLAGVRDQMEIETLLAAECFIADMADLARWFEMCSQVAIEERLGDERILTDRASVRPFTGVRPQMFLQLHALPVPLVADVAGEWPFARVRPIVFLQGTRPTEGLAAQSASIFPGALMPVHMFSQRTLLQYFLAEFACHKTLLTEHQLIVATGIRSLIQNRFRNVEFRIEEHIDRRIIIGTANRIGIVFVSVNEKLVFFFFVEIVFRTIVIDNAIRGRFQSWHQS